VRPLSGLRLETERLVLTVVTDDGLPALGYLARDLAGRDEPASPDALPYVR
jgi:hypothetical protein